VFIRPLAPSSAVSPPTGTQWLHEPKWHALRFQVVKNGSTVRFYSRNGTDYTERLPGMRKSFAAELCLVDLRGAAQFYQLMWQMRARWPDESRLMFLAFDLLHLDGWDLRSQTLTQRKKDLNRLCRGARVHYLHQVEVFADGEVLFDYSNRFGFEGVVSKRRASGYASGSR